MHVKEVAPLVVIELGGAVLQTKFSAYRTVTNGGLHLPAAQSVHGPFTISGLYEPGAQIAQGDPSCTKEYP